tara:strand:- start:23746 stop:24990 length:1245 start_codon:yes stop_codon:yes gene_type:complete
LASILDFFRTKPQVKPQEERFYGTGVYNTSLMGNASGQPVDKLRSLQLSSVWSCVRVISETIASLPISLYEKDSTDKRYILSSNPLHLLVGEQPSTLYNSFNFFEKALVDLCLDGNFYAYIERNNGGLPTQIIPIQCDDVTVYVSPDGREVYYQIEQNETIPYPITGKVNSDNMLHIRGLSCDGVVGKSPIQTHAQSLGVSLSIEQFAGSFFKNGSSLGGILKHPGTLKPETAKRLRASWNETYSGSINAGKTAILEEGMEFQSKTIPNNQAQFLETRQYQVSDIARIFRVPNHLINDLSDASYNNVESMQIDFAVHTITPWIKRIEMCLNQKLIPFNKKGTQYFKFNMNALLRGDSKSRADYYRTLVNIGVMSPDEVRQHEDLNSMGGESEKVYMQSNMMPLDKLGESTKREI